MPSTPTVSCLFLTSRGEEAQRRLDDREFEPSSAEDGESMHQVFSVSSHPALPILVFSDGYMVTFAQLPGDLNTFTFMRSLVLESSKHLKQVDGKGKCFEVVTASSFLHWKSACLWRFVLQLKQITWEGKLFKLWQLTHFSIINRLVSEDFFLSHK